MRTPVRTLLLLGAVAAAAVPAGAEEIAGLTVHGFISQGYIRTTENELYFGHTTDGNFEFNEAALSFSTEPIPRLRIGMQLLRAGPGLARQPPRDRGLGRGRLPPERRVRRARRQAQAAARPLRHAARRGPRPSGDPAAGGDLQRQPQGPGPRLQRGLGLRDLRAGRRRLPRLRGVRRRGQHRRHRGRQAHREHPGRAVRRGPHGLGPAPGARVVRPDRRDHELHVRRRARVPAAGAGPAAALLRLDARLRAHVARDASRATWARCPRPSCSTPSSS